jgi:hypothetical protein
VAGSCEYGDETSDSGATELVNFTYACIDYSYHSLILTLILDF